MFLSSFRYTYLLSALTLVTSTAGMLYWLGLYPAGFAALRSSSNYIGPEVCKERELVSLLLPSNSIDVQAIEVENIAKQEIIPVREITERKVKPLQDQYLKGFSSGKVNVHYPCLSIQGTFPNWLTGSLVQVGPLRFEVAQASAHYWLDGFAGIHRFTLNGSSVSYANTLLDTTYHKESCAKGTFSGLEPQKSKGSFFSRVATALSSAERPVYDNVNTNVMCHCGQLCAMAESSHSWVIQKDTLKNTQQVTYSDALDPQFICAHPHFDNTRGQWIGCGIKFGHTSEYIFYSLNSHSFERTVIARIASSYPTYLHSFGLTPDYIVLLEYPFTVNTYDLALNGKPFIQNFNWNAKQPTLITVIDRISGKKIATYKMPAVFALHQVNAYQMNQKIIIDIAAYSDASIIKALELGQMHGSQRTHFPCAYLTRYTLDLSNKKGQSATICPVALEMPDINQKYAHRSYKYVYGIGRTAQRPDVLADQLVKIDVTNGNACIWHEPLSYPTQPTFVPSPNACSEDEGVILSTVLDGKTGMSYLVCLNAQDMKEIARAYVPGHIPFIMHGGFYSNF